MLLGTYLGTYLHTYIHHTYTTHSPPPLCWLVVCPSPLANSGPRCMRNPVRCLPVPSETPTQLFVPYSHSLCAATSNTPRPCPTLKHRITTSSKLHFFRSLHALQANCTRSVVSHPALSLRSPTKPCANQPPRPTSKSHKPSEPDSQTPLFLFGP
jgi:hypothetical protein